MGTNIRPEVTKKSQYYINRERYYELLHKCRQYDIWKEKYRQLAKGSIPCSASKPEIGKAYGNPTENSVILMEDYAEKIALVNECAHLADEYMAPYIILAITQKLSYEYMNSFMGLAASKSSFYEKYRKFFWLMDQKVN